jgi:hypothetical protein
MDVITSAESALAPTLDRTASLAAGTSLSRSGNPNPPNSDSVATSNKIINWLHDNNIRITLSAPYRHEQNGQIERDVQYVMDKARTLMMSYDVPRMFWEYAVKMACWYINRSPTSRLHNMTPLECAIGIKPNLNDMIPFYCPGICHITNPERRGAYDGKGRPCRV